MAEKSIAVSIRQQSMLLWEGESMRHQYSISTAKNGAGEKYGSECTPRGHFIIRAKIGAGCTENTVFVARRANGEIYSAQLGKQFPQCDWILTRILWLSGLELGKNRLGDVDTMRRFIYIHGCPDEDQMGVPTSHGCIKMRNADVIQLFELVQVGTAVRIKEG